MLQDEVIAEQNYFMTVRFYKSGKTEIVKSFSSPAKDSPAKKRMTKTSRILKGGSIKEQEVLEL